MSLSKIAEGLTLLAKYDPDGEVAAEHDELWSAGPIPTELTYAERKRLDELGFTWDESMKSWHRFV